MNDTKTAEAIEYAVPATVESPDHITPPSGRLNRWLLQHRVQPVGPEADESHAKPQSWWKVMCLT
ncbi:hypothetical protein AB0B66_33820, partial [Catellatospora sp. NPDC049111]|uniref:hypothetical protein n=1 Tax=Catellatospora sp. NPDC049111 TaxID=3155271 RepID=UPI0033E1B22A